MLRKLSLHIADAGHSIYDTTNQIDRKRSTSQKISSHGNINISTKTMISKDKDADDKNKLDDEIITIR